MKNISVLPINQKFLTQSRLTSLDFNEEQIRKIIRALNIHKAHGHDDISIRMIKICDKSPLKPLSFLFQIQINLTFVRLTLYKSTSCAFTHEIYEAFDCNLPLKVRSVFLDISKTFDKVCHEGLLYKHRSVDISGELYNLLGNFQVDFKGLC